MTQIDTLTIKFRRGTANEWENSNPVLFEGEPGYETDTRKLKIGDGFSAWVSLPYLTNGGGGGGDVELMLLEHIESITPHPEYDDMQSLVGLFENGLA